MTDQQFLAWIHERLKCVYDENTMLDYMHRLRSIILSMSPDFKASNTANTGDLSLIAEILIHDEHSQHNPADLE